MKLTENIPGVAALLLAVMALVVFYLTFDSDDADTQAVAPKLPLSNEAEYTETFNRAINRANDTHKKYLDYVKTDEGKEASDEYWNKMLKLGEARTRDIEFYGLILDQTDLPVPGAMVHFDARSGYLAKGSGHQRTQSNSEGVFVISDVVGTGLSINKMEKKGYQFQFDDVKDFDNYLRYDDSKLWGDYTRDNPFLFRAWRVGDKGYPNTSKAKTTYGFKLDQIYSMDFTTSNRRKVKKEGQKNLDMQVLFSRDESGNWELKLSVPDGGLIETDQLYMNLAPESGYRENLVYNGTGDDHMVSKNFYIHSRGKLYGRLKVEIRPVMKIGSGLGIEHVINLDGGRSLEAM